MSSDDEHESKKRRLTRACDVCRRRKVKCDGDENEKCSNCTQNSVECTFLLSAPKRLPRKTNLCTKCRNPLKDAAFSPSDTIQQLETRLLRMHALLRTFMSSEDIETKLKNDVQSTTFRSSLSNFVQEDPPEDDVDELQEELSSLSLQEGHYYGKSSSAGLFFQASGYKKTISGTSATFPLSSSKELPWETTVPCEVLRRPFVFPPDDLLYSLVEIYFDQINIHLPFLHRPTFSRQLASGLHHTNRAFGANVLVVCASASRFSDDPRIFMEEYGSQPLTSGWKWFSQVQLLQESALYQEEGSELFNLQFYSLTLMFLAGGSTKVQLPWVLTGIGLRLGQHLGADKKKKGPLTVHNELMKRAWWVLVVIDKMVASGLGRSSGIDEDDITQELPLECDDEYWEHSDPEIAFKQPPNQPSTVTSFVMMIKLVRILSVAMRTLYSNRSHHHAHRENLEELESALNLWEHELPDHLRWDPQRKDDLFFAQSAYLRNFHHFLQIFIHRPFIPSPGQVPKVTTPSLFICANTARSSIRIMEAILARGSGHYPWLMGGAFSAAVILLLDVMARKREGHKTNNHREMEDIQKCIDLIKMCTDRWQPATQLVASLTELASLGDATFGSSAPRGQKRDRLTMDDLKTDSVFSTAEKLYHPKQGPVITPIIEGLPSSSVSPEGGYAPPVYDATPMAPDYTSWFSPQGTTAGAPSHEFGLWHSMPGYLSLSDTWGDFMNSVQFQNTEYQSGYFTPEGPQFGAYPPNPSQQ